jgi:hypothetical protein
VSDVPPGAPEPGRPRPPRVSGKFAAAWLAVGFVLSAALVPMALHLPLWIDAEIVLAIWWAVWFAVLARFLYTGSRITDDHRWSSPRRWVTTEGMSSTAVDGCFWLPIADEGCLIILGLIALVFAAWFLIEVAVPALMLLVYAIVRGMLAHVANDRHHCRGNLARSIGWAFLWATLYTAPYAGAVWLVHFIHGRR